MRKLQLAAVLLVGLVSMAVTIDLNELDNYANQPIPSYITKDNTPPDNPITDEGATLGRVLFYDKSLSINNTISCGSCHLQEFGFSDTAQQSVGVAGVTGRHAMRLVNARFGEGLTFFWDRRAATLEEQTTQPIQDHGEMGFSGTLGDPNFDSLLTKMGTIDYYGPLFELAFGDDTINEDRMQKSLAQFVRSIQSFDSKFDEGRALVPNDAAPFPNYTANENAGKQLFLTPPVFNPSGVRTAGGTGCNSCHEAPEFDIDPGSENNGVINSFTMGVDFGNFRSPSLRDMINPAGLPNGPFMHDGGATTGPGLEGVIEHYNMIPGLTPILDPRLRVGPNPQNLALTALEKTQLLEFMGTLSGSNVYSDSKWSDPFADGSLDLILLNCPTPTNTFVENITTTNAKLNWDEVPTSVKYRVQGTNTTTGSIATKLLSGATNNSLPLIGRLDPGTTYIWTVEAACSLTDISAPSLADTFTTSTMRLPVSEVMLFPNPATHYVQLSALPFNTNISLTVFDESGRLMLAEEKLTNESGIVELALNGLNSGLYQVNIIWENNSITKSLVFAE